MRPLPFDKAHALGNDFLLIPAVELEGLDPSAVAQRICSRHTGVGADGLVLLGPENDSILTLRIFNADGSEAEISGNALRCAAAWRAEQLEIPPDRLIVGTRVGTHDIFCQGRRGGAWIFRTEIGRPVFAAEKIPFRPPRRMDEPLLDVYLPVGDENIAVSVLSMGNPQCVVFVEDFDLVDWRSLGAELERHPWFLERTNVSFARVAAQDRIEARFWERGAGHTRSSGTGACACAVAAHLQQMTERRVKAQSEIGEVEVNWREDQMVELTGPAELVAEGSFHWLE